MTKKPITEMSLEELKQEIELEREKTRIINEQTRIIAEETRIIAEETRIIVEETRIINEQRRIIAEKTLNSEILSLHYKKRFVINCRMLMAEIMEKMARYYRRTRTLPNYLLKNKDADGTV